VASAARRRAKVSLATRIRTYWIVAVVPLALIAFGLYELERWSGFRASHVGVSGERIVAKADVLARAAVDPHANVWTLDIASIERRVEAIPYVDVAVIHRALPATFDIAITERTPNGCVRADDGEYVTVDAARRVLVRGCLAGRIMYAPGGIDPLAPGTFLHSSTLAALQDDVRALHGTTYATVRHDSLGGVIAERRDGVAVLFGTERDLAEKERIADAVLAKVGASHLRSVDVRAEATPVIVKR
jgi:hypothetical protein